MDERKEKYINDEIESIASSMFCIHHVIYDSLEKRNVFSDTLSITDNHEMMITI